MPPRSSRPDRDGAPRQAASDLIRLVAVSLGLTLYQACSILPFSSTRNAERRMPMYLRPYIDFSVHTSYFSAMAWSSSASNGKPSEYLSSNFFCFVGLSGL